MAAVTPQLSVAATVTTCEPAGPALLTRTTPVSALTVTVPLKPLETATVTPVITPLSVGGAVGVRARDWPMLTRAEVYAPNIGPVLAAMLTVMLALVVKPPPSVTVRTTVFAPTAAPQPAVTCAETVPLVLAKPLSAMPLGILVAATVRLPAGVASSLTVARFEVKPALPCCLVSGAAALTVGALLTVRTNDAEVVAPQLSVAITVIVCEPEGAALLIFTTPAALTDNAPVKPLDAATVSPTLPLSAGATPGVTVADAPELTKVAA